MPAPARARFLLLHLWVPGAVVLAASAVLTGGGVDQDIADVLYRWQGGHWSLRDNGFLQVLIHHGGKLASTAGALAMMLLALVPWHPDHLRRLRRPAAYLALSVALSTGAVAWLKRWTRMDCPWDISRYGGHRPLLGLFDPRHGLAASGCFPAGHASAGYAWVALYFVALAWWPAWRWRALAIGLGAGLVFGIAQQARGAHFASHDLAALAICWCVALVLHQVLLRSARTMPAGRAA